MTDGGAGSDRGRVPTLAYAILVLVAREALTGYEIEQRMDDPIGHFWRARHSQIYPMLARIEAIGWVDATAGPGPGPRPKRRYLATSAGVSVLRDWVESPRGRRGRDDLLLRVFASWVASTGAVWLLLQAAEAEHAARLQEYLRRRAVVQARGGPAAPGSAEFADYATLRRGIGFERGRLAWVHWLRRQLVPDAADE